MVERSFYDSIEHPKIRALKGQRQMVTLSLGTASLARVADEFCDLILVGDSINMTIYGQPSTRGISLETMIAHGKSVVRSTKNAAVVVDMPFGTYEQSPSQAFANAERVLRETECDAVKLEGGLAMVPTIEFLIARGVPSWAMLVFIRSIPLCWVVSLRNVMRTK